MDQIKRLKELLEFAEMEAEKFYNKGNHSAGTRLRQRMQNMKDVCQEVREDVQKIKKSKS